MTRAQQTQVIARLQAIHAMLGSVNYARLHGDWADDAHCPPRIIGACQHHVEMALEAAGAKPRAGRS